MNIAQPHRFGIELIFALAGAVVTPCNRNLVTVAREGAVFVIKAQCYLGIAQRSSYLCTAEYNVLHFGAAQIFGGLLTENPAHSVGNVAFAGAVGSHHGSYSAAEIKHRFIRE